MLLPAITLQFASISEIFGGSVLVEQVFSYPGLGQAAVTAGLGSDVPLLLGITLNSAVFVFAGNLTADLFIPGGGSENGRFPGWKIEGGAKTEGARTENTKNRRGQRQTERENMES